MAGTTTTTATNVTVNGLLATQYMDATFALGGFTVTNGTNKFIAIAKDRFGNHSTNSVTVFLPATNNYTYDLNGNLLTDRTRNFIYDTENELIGVWATNSWSNSFAYDGLQRRRIEQEFSWNTGSSSWQLTNEILFVYDGNLVFQERDQNDMTLTTYTRGNDLSGTLQGAGGIGGLLARSDKMQIIPYILSPANPNPQYVNTAFYHSDGNGNITALVQPSGLPVAMYQYDPYGNILAIGGLLANENKYRFSSKEWNDNAGLYYYGYRFYDPNLQRWVNGEPLRDWGGLALLARSLGQEAETGSASAIPTDEFVGLAAEINVNLSKAMDNDPANNWDALGLKTCTGQARALQGNSETIGKPGGFSGPKNPVNVAANSAAVDPAQWGGKSQLRPDLGKISGTFTDASGKKVGSFSGISDVIGGKSPLPKTNVRDALKQLNPGKLIIELPSADEDLGSVNVTLTVPDNVQCPQGTTQTSP